MITIINKEYLAIKIPVFDYITVPDKNEDGVHYPQKNTMNKYFVWYGWHNKYKVIYPLQNFGKKLRGNDKYVVKFFSHKICAYMVFSFIHLVARTLKQRLP